MDAKVNYTVVGIFIIALSIALIYSIVWLTTGVSSKHYTTYVANVHESVSGLSVQSPVKYNGVQVGYVTSISLNPHDPSQVRLLLNIESDAPIRTDTTATIESQGLTGLAYVGLRGGSPHAALLTIEPGQDYPVIQTRPSLFLRLDTALRNLTGNLDNITQGIKSVFDDQNQQTFKSILNNLQNTTSVLAKNSERLNTLLDNLNVVLKNTATASQQFPQLTQNANKTLLNLQSMSESVKNTSQQFAIAVKKGTVTLNQVTSQITPQLYDALQNFANLSGKLSFLTNELQHNPAMLIRGKLPAAPGPGES
ncbi:MAG: MCE family protein [Legionellales bacterium]|nr:MCE family protein [Legionellales bacterium]